MFSLTDDLNFFLYPTPTDMRKNFDGLSGLISGGLKRSPIRLAQIETVYPLHMADPCTSGKEGPLLG